MYIKTKTVWSNSSIQKTEILNFNKNIFMHISKNMVKNCVTSDTNEA